MHRSTLSRNPSMSGRRPLSPQGSLSFRNEGSALEPSRGTSQRIPRRSEKRKVSPRVVPLVTASTKHSLGALVPSEQVPAEHVYSYFGGVDQGNARRALKELGVNHVPDSLLDTFFATKIPPKTKFLSRRQFLSLLMTCKKYYLEEQEEEALSSHPTSPGGGQKEAVCAFAAIGGNADRSGFLEQEQLRVLCANFGLGIDIEAFMEEVDEDGNGQVEFDEFMQLLTYDGASPEMLLSFQACGAKPDPQQDGYPVCIELEEFLALVPVPSSVLIQLAADSEKFVSIGLFCEICETWGRTGPEVAALAQRALAQRTEDEELELIETETLKAQGIGGKVETLALDAHYARRMNRRVDRLMDSHKNSADTNRQKRIVQLKSAGMKGRKPRPPIAVSAVVSSGNTKLKPGSAPQQVPRYQQQQQRKAQEVSPSSRQTFVSARGPTAPRPPSARERMLRSLEGRSNGSNDWTGWAAMPRTNRPLSRHSPYLVGSFSPGKPGAQGRSPSRSSRSPSSSPHRESSAVPWTPSRNDDLGDPDRTSSHTSQPSSHEILAAVTIQRAFWRWKGVAVDQAKIASTVLQRVGRGMFGRRRVGALRAMVADMHLKRIGRGLMARVALSEKYQLRACFGLLEDFLVENTNLALIQSKNSSDPIERSTRNEELSQRPTGLSSTRRSPSQTANEFGASFSRSQILGARGLNFHASEISVSRSAIHDEDERPTAQYQDEEMDQAEVSCSVGADAQADDAGASRSPDATGEKDSTPNPTLFMLVPVPPAGGNPDDKNPMITHPGSAQQRRDSNSVVGWSCREETQNHSKQPQQSTWQQQDDKSNSSATMSERSIKSHQASYETAVSEASLTVPNPQWKPKKKKKRGLFHGGSSLSSYGQVSGVSDDSVGTPNPRTIMALSSEGLINESLFKNQWPAQGATTISTQTEEFDTGLSRPRSGPMEDSYRTSRTRVDLVSVSIQLPKELVDKNTVVLKEESFLVAKFPHTQEVFRTLAEPDQTWCPGGALFTVSPSSAEEGVEEGGLTVELGIVHTCDGHLNVWRVAAVIPYVSIVHPIEQRHSVSLHGLLRKNVETAGGDPSSMPVERAESCGTLTLTTRPLLEMSESSLETQNPAPELVAGTQNPEASPLLVHTDTGTFKSQTNTEPDSQTPETPTDAESTKTRSAMHDSTTTAEPTADTRPGEILEDDDATNARIARHALLAVLEKDEDDGRIPVAEEEAQTFEHLMAGADEGRALSEEATKQKEAQKKAVDQASERASLDARAMLRPIYEKFFLFGGSSQGTDQVLVSSNPQIPQSETDEEESIVARSLARFLGEYQRENDADKDQVIATFNAASHQKQRRDYSKRGANERQMSYDEFCSFLLDPTYNNVLAPREEDVWMSMNQPLHHYWINSSHNTYLTGNQFSSDSSVEMYKSVLREGCRCVEIDCWDGPNDEPIVYHGYTRTSKIKFRDVIIGINKTAFCSSPYPVILSLENHCSPKQCSVMATIMKDVFGPVLYSLADLLKDKCDTWTPAKLKYKILIKWKIHRDGVDDPKDKTGANTDAETPREGRPTSPRQRSTRSPSPPATEKDLKKKLVEELCKLVVVESIKTKDWALTAKGYQVQSIVEGVSDTWSEKEQNNFRFMTSRMLVRVYPGGWRVGSANYSPLPAWQHGAQLVALNFQTPDEPMIKNRCIFKDTNGGCGYILKPLALRDPTLYFESGIQFSVKLTIVLGVGFVLPTKTGDVDVAVTITIHGSPEDTKRNPERSTKTVDKNGYSPFWGEAFKLDLSTLRGTFVTMTVKSKGFFGDTVLASRTLSLGACRPGLRCIPLDTPSAMEEVLQPVLLCQLELFATGDSSSAPTSPEGVQRFLPFSVVEIAKEGISAETRRIGAQVLNKKASEDEGAADDETDESVCGARGPKGTKRPPRLRNKDLRTRRDNGKLHVGSSPREDSSRISSNNSSISRTPPSRTSPSSSPQLFKAPHPPARLRTGIPTVKYPSRLHKCATTIQKWIRGCKGRDVANDRFAELWAIEVYRQMEEDTLLEELDLAEEEQDVKNRNTNH